MIDSWKYQKELKKKKIPNQQELIMMIDTIPQARIKALISIAYLTGGRISEIVPIKYLYKTTYTQQEIKGKIKLIQIKKEKIPHIYKGICRKDLNYENFDGQKMLIIDIENRKNRQRHLKRIPVPVEKESRFIKYIDDYTQTLEVQQPLFKFGTHRAWVIIRKYTGYNCHMFRDIRATHLVTLYNFNAWKLKLYLGWTDIRPSENYVILNIRDIWTGV